MYDLTKREYVALEIFKAMISSGRVYFDNRVIDETIQSSFQAADVFFGRSNTAYDPNLKPCASWKPGDGCGSGGRCGETPCMLIKE